MFEPLIDLPVGPRPQQARTHGNLTVTVHWSMLGVDIPDDTIQEPTAAETHASFISRLITQFGPEMSGKLQRIAVARSYPLSENPKQDFLNPRTREAYSHKPVPGTSLFLFTNTSTSEKRDDILALCRTLGFPSGAVVVS
ncbi:MAG TPA: hypothetical protein P5555_01305 [Candidatus Paceibacterota bacterium]|nr:hypothetical protein [Candidatus Hydrogenedentota bacterium]HOX00924.1 hypothetical protein [Verrucomicrobiota bacterium]HRZ43810.1 hypothetical protein [Candidatus Paceibacterota bacterium]